jgi:hypothetical protein
MALSLISASFLLLLQTGNASIEGVVVSSTTKGTVRKDPQTAPAQVVLVPDQRDRYDLYRLATTDPAGSFTLRAVPPGSYKAFAWQQIERNSWFDPVVMRAYEQNGVPVRSGGSSDVTLDLNVIQATTR